MPKVGTTSKKPSKKNNPILKESGQQKKSNKKGNGSTPTVKKEILYPRVEVRLFVNDPNKTPLDSSGKPTEATPLTMEVAKQLLQWQTEEEAGLELPKDVKGKEQKANFGDDFILKDLHGNKVRCLANLHNRPFYQGLANDWKLEILRKQWKFNGESIIIDETGMDQDGQHRLIGLVLAVQEWELDREKPKPEQKWQKLWHTEPYIESLVVLGISSADAVVNTLNTGKKRSAEDAIYRSEWCQSKPLKDRLALAKICGKAIKFIWDRTSYGDASLAPRRPHSETFEFLNRHPRIKECSEAIYQTAEGNALSDMIPLGTAAGLLYLMGSSATSADQYNGINSEEAIDWSLWEKAYDFFVDLADNGKPTEPVREVLLSIPDDSGAFGYRLRIGSLIKAWHSYSDGTKLVKEEVEVNTDRNGDGQLVIAESPRVGGIDVEFEKEERVADEPNPVVEGTAPECIKGGQHEWKTEDGETFCVKCFAPSPKSKRK